MERYLATVDILQSLSPEEREQLASASRERFFAKGETVFFAGEPADALHLVKEGRVHMKKFMDNGHAVTLCLMTKNELFCCLPALDGKPFALDAVAAVDSVVVRIPREAFKALLDRNPRFLQDVLENFCGRLRRMEQKGCIAGDPVEQRLAYTLLVLSDKFGETIPLTKQELASMTNTTVETTIRVLSHLKKQGVVESSRGSTTIVQRDRLKGISEAP
ncbi:MAG: Crp/Fnr family transcriptional regulator [Candidatus Omnitrophica bacterium]|nr:Crp/Fnr family transcriptional regulator [Candidatus Omnitrophota bacterium]